MKDKKNDILLSVIMISYNHSRYIRQAIESVLKQKTDFKFEVVIGDDCSSDNTQNIIKEYSVKYPEIIKPVLRQENIGATYNLFDLIKRCKGKYIAFLEGDDYYTDEYKLQKQAEFLENNKSYKSCGYPIEIVDRDNNHLLYTLSDLKLNIPFGSKEFIRYNTDMLHLNSIVTYNFYRDDYEKYENIFTCNKYSVHSTTLLLLLTQSDIFVMDRPMSAWRCVRDENADNYTSRAKYFKAEVHLEKIRQYRALKDYFSELLPEIDFSKMLSVVFWEAISSLKSSGESNSDYTVYKNRFKELLTPGEIRYSYRYGYCYLPVRKAVGCIKGKLRGIVK